MQITDPHKEIQACKESPDFNPALFDKLCQRIGVLAPPDYMTLIGMSNVSKTATERAVFLERVYLPSAKKATIYARHKGYDVGVFLGSPAIFWSNPEIEGLPDFTLHSILIESCCLRRMLRKKPELVFVPDDADAMWKLAIESITLLSGQLLTLQNHLKGENESLYDPSYDIAWHLSVDAEEEDIQDCQETIFEFLELVKKQGQVENECFLHIAVLALCCFYNLKGKK